MNSLSDDTPRFLCILVFLHNYNDAYTRLENLLYSVKMDVILVAHNKLTQRKGFTVSEYSTFWKSVKKHVNSFFTKLQLKIVAILRKKRIISLIQKQWDKKKN